MLFWIILQPLLSRKDYVFVSVSQIIKKKEHKIKNN